jgi:hypothetical protein
MGYTTPTSELSQISGYQLFKLIAKRVLLTAIAALSVRAWFVSTPALANGVNSGTLTVQSGTYVCDCTGSGNSCGCITKP